ncbi:MAG: histone deacetylase family protein [Candidatus Bathyarchaeia archaeon]
MKTGIIYHERFCQYDLGVGHPFRGNRFAESRLFLREKGLDDSPDVIFIEPEMAMSEDLTKVHTRKYIDLIFRLAEFNKSYDLETPVSTKILEGLMFIIGGAIKAGTSICKGKVGKAVNLGGGFHHAGRDYGGGFCIFNDVAILTEHLRQTYRFKRILILDFDVHFGNGTSDIFYSDPDVLYISLHQDPRTIFPGRGFIEEIGSGDGKGYNVNVPFPPRTGEATYLRALEDVFEPLAEEFKPDIIIANGGSDAHFADSLGKLGVTVNGFFEMAQIVRETSDEICDGKIVLLLGSGYNPRVLPYCWYALISGILGLEALDIQDPYPPPKDPWRNREKVEGLLGRLRSILKEYWKCF